MRKCLHCLVALLVLYCFAIPSSFGEAPPAFNPSKTWLFAVGVLKFQDADTTSWDPINRRDTQIVSWFKAAGVPGDHVVYISDSAAVKSNIDQKFSLLLPRIEPGDLLIVYYTGHGADGSFETYDGSWWEMSSIVKKIDHQCKAAHALLLGDCCQSGSLAEAVSGEQGPIGYAVLSSSSKTEEGHGNWTFSEALLEALRGNPVADTNKDGLISLQEIADYIKKDILTYENNHSAFRATDPLFPQMTLAKATSNAYFAPQPVEVFYHDAWWAGKLLERKSSEGRIRWIQLGYDTPDQDVWIELNKIRPLTDRAQR